MNNKHTLGLAISLALSLIYLPYPLIANAKTKHAATAKSTKVDAKNPKKSKAVEADNSNKNGPMLVGTYADWSAFTALKGANRTCYALSQPKKRAPDGLHRDPAYVFVSDRPAKNVHNEISIIMGFPMKDGTAATAMAGDASFDMIGTGTTLWLKNPAQDSAFLASLRKSSKLVVAAPSVKGHLTTDIYSLHGLAQALEKATKECK